MSGLFGGYLGLVNVIGGGILYLLIGAKAHDPRARVPRLLFGSLVVGLTIGLLAPLTMFESRDLGLALIACSFLGVLASAILTGVLEWIRYHLEK